MSLFISIWLKISVFITILLIPTSALAQFNKTNIQYGVQFDVTYNSVRYWAESSDWCKPEVKMVMGSWSYNKGYGYLTDLPIKRGRILAKEIQLACPVAQTLEVRFDERKVKKRKQKRKTYNLGEIGGWDSSIPQSLRPGTDEFLKERVAAGLRKNSKDYTSFWMLFSIQCNNSSRDHSRCREDDAISLKTEKGRVFVTYVNGYEVDDRIKRLVQPTVDSFYASSRVYEMLMYHTRNDPAQDVVEFWASIEGDRQGNSLDYRIENGHTFSKLINAGMNRYGENRFQLSKTQIVEIEREAAKRADERQAYLDSPETKARDKILKARSNRMLERHYAAKDFDPLTQMERLLNPAQSQAIIDASKVTGDAFEELPGPWGARMRLVMSRDFGALAEAARLDAQSNSLLFTGMGLSDILNPNISDKVTDQLAKDRYEGFAAQYALARTELFGLCGSSSASFRVSRTWIQERRNGFGHLLSTSQQSSEDYVISIPSEFSDSLRNSRTTGVGWATRSSLMNFSRRLGGCGSAARMAFEKNLLDYQEY